MKISEMIDRLNGMQEAHGDIEFQVFDPNRQVRDKTFQPTEVVLVLRRHDNVIKAVVATDTETYMTMGY